ncbi:hypothetical protein [Streptomyces sp. NPDC102487]|uniref:hypothetical protein n=1 Tax=Streptomyces sp. NPDC102487 TaxID=3366182 RepID=UPI0037FE2BFC
MDAVRRVVTRDDLDAVARAVFGNGRRLRGVSRLRGGSKKGVYRLDLDDDSTAVVYIWDASENYWPATGAGADRVEDPFSPASGLDLFEAAHRNLHQLGIRTPQLLLHYAGLSGGDLDGHRMTFYTLAMHLSLVAGPLRLLDGDFPERDVMRGIAEHNLREALAFLPAAQGDRI